MMSSSQPSYSRRSFLATGLSIAVMSYSGPTLCASQHDQSLFSATPDDLLDMILAAPDRDSAIDALVEVFARSGIAVFDDAVAAPLTTVEDPVSPLSFQRWHLNVMIDELVSGNVRPAAEFDTLAPATTEDGAAVLTVGEMLAGYSAAATPGAAFVQAYLHRVIPETFLLSAAELPMPTVLAGLSVGRCSARCMRPLPRRHARRQPSGAPACRHEA